MKKFFIVLLAMAICFGFISSVAAEDNWRELPLDQLLKYQPKTEESQEYIEKLLLRRDRLIKEVRESRFPAQDKNNLADLIWLAVYEKYTEITINSVMEEIMEHKPPELPKFIFEP